MARMLRPLRVAAILVLLSGSGCASWRHSQAVDGDSASYPPNPSDGGIFQRAIQDLATASMYDWNFGRFWW
jgi:hypothetical protein